MKHGNVCLPEFLRPNPFRAHMNKGNNIGVRLIATLAISNSNLLLYLQVLHSKVIGMENIRQVEKNKFT